MKSANAKQVALAGAAHALARQAAARLIGRINRKLQSLRQGEATASALEASEDRANSPSRRAEALR